MILSLMMHDIGFKTPNIFGVLKYLMLRRMILVYKVIQST